MRLAIALVAAAALPLARRRRRSPSCRRSSDEAKAKAAETAAKSAWTDKVARLQAVPGDGPRRARSTARSTKPPGKDAPAPVATPPCTDPGPFVPSRRRGAKPLEAAGAHSPPRQPRRTPPSNKADRRRKMTGHRANSRCPRLRLTCRPARRCTQRDRASATSSARERSISIPAERALTVFVDKRELVTLMTLGAAPELLVLGYLRNQRLVDARRRRSIRSPSTGTSTPRR